MGIMADDGSPVAASLGPSEVHKTSSVEGERLSDKRKMVATSNHQRNYHHHYQDSISLPSMDKSAKYMCTCIIKCASIYKYNIVSIQRHSPY